MSESDRDALVKRLEELKSYCGPRGPITAQDNVQTLDDAITALSAPADAEKELAVEIPLEPSLVIPAQQIVDWSAHLKKNNLPAAHGISAKWVVYAEDAIRAASAQNAGVQPKREWVDELASQYGARQHADLRGDQVASKAANFWMSQIADKHWHEIIQALRAAPSAPDAGQVVVPVEFVEWLVSQMPPGTVISNPNWWASRIYRAAIRAAGSRHE